MKLRPITLKDARAFVSSHHRHHIMPQGGLFAVAVEHDGLVCGVAIIGRPVSRGMADGYTAEVTRLCTVGKKNAASMLYGAAWRAARALGYERLVTYTLKSESGTSLRASGYRVLHEVKGRSWSCPSRPRTDKHPITDKTCWVVGADRDHGGGK